MCCVEGNIYLVGGSSGDRRVTEYNPRTKTWRNMLSLQEGRYNRHIVCTLGHKIFVLGGGTTTCEMLDLSDDDPQWRYIAEMNNDHGDGGAVVKKKKNYAYVLGGCTTNVDVYDVDQNQWTSIVTNMPTRWESGVAALDNKIYVTGGHNGPIRSSVYCYDPDTNTWSQVANMNIARQQHSLVSHGRLYAIGGDGVDSVEAYDPDNDTWTLLQHKLNGKVRLTGAGLIKKYYLIK